MNFLQKVLKSRGTEDTLPRDREAGNSKGGEAGAEYPGQVFSNTESTSIHRTNIASISKKKPKGPLKSQSNEFEEIMLTIMETSN